MKDISRNIIKLLLIAILPLFIWSCLKEDTDDCGVYLEFIYDYNMEYSNTFEKNVDVVDVFVFDADGKYLFANHSPREQLMRGKRMSLFRDMAFGSYKILTVGGLSDKFSISAADGNNFVVGATTIEDVRIALERQSEIVPHEFPPIWVAEPLTITYDDPLAIYKVNLIKDTNRFNLKLIKRDEETPSPSENAFSFEIETPEGAVYGYDNSPLSKEKVTYKAYSLTPGTGSENMSTGLINTVRLFYGSDYKYKLSIRHVDSGKIVWYYDLMKLLEETKKANPEIASLPMQEYLDRQSEWNLEVLYKGDASDPESFIAVGVIVNNWIVWLHNIEV